LSVLYADYFSYIFLGLYCWLELVVI
jgi:hypothetical protein